MTTKPNILLIVMDAVRVDSLSCYGYHKKTTPNIDRLAEQGTLFENAFSASAWTPPAHGSIFTGDYPSRHGVLRPNLYLDPSNITLAEILAKNGYRTIAFSSPHITPARGFDKGFQEFYLPYIYRDVFKNIYKDFDLVRQSARNVFYGWDKLAFYITQKIKGKIKENVKKNNPFFIYVNYKLTHNPYYRDGIFKRIKYNGLDGEKIKGLAGLLGCKYNNGEMEISREEMETVKLFYDNGITHLDSILGGLFGFLVKRKILENTLIVILADHGDCFGEHRLMYHTASLYDELIHVPLIMIYSPQIPKSRRIKGLVSLIDVFPTILELAEADPARIHNADITRSNPKIDGVSLADFEDRDYHKYVFAERDRAKIVGPLNQELKCVRDKNYKYILDEEGLAELYDMNKDPFEQNNIAPKEAEIALKYKNIISENLNPFGVLPKGRRDVQEEKKIIEKLKALGY